MKYNANEIASYIVNKSIEMNCPVSNLKLQKLLYYVQAASLVIRGEVLFKDDIVAWPYGPVVKNVYDKYRIYLSNDIEKQNDCTEIDCDSKELINSVLIGKSIDSAFDMVYTTHGEDPWRETNMYDVIDKESIKKYFLKGENRERIWVAKQNLA